MFLFAGRVLAAGSPVIAEANFFRGDQESQFAALPPHRLVQIHCHAPLDVLLERYANRTDRHPGHLSGLRVDELAERYGSGRNGPLDLDGEPIGLDTSGPVDVDALAERLRNLL